MIILLQYLYLDFWIVYVYNLTIYQGSLMVKISNVDKSYSKFSVLKNISLEVERGVIFGLLGPNGAGKSTLIKILCGILSADTGNVEIDGQNVERVKKLFGYVAQSFGQYEELSVWENISFYAQMYGVDDEQRLEYLLRRYDLQKYKDRRAGRLSGGYQRRLALVCALVHDPEVLFLDEPTAGIDPVTRKLLWDDFYALSIEGKTLFVTTHYMEEAERCNKLAFLASGEIVRVGTPHMIQNSLENIDLYKIESKYNPEVIKKLSKYEGVKLINQFGDELRLLLSSSTSLEELEELLQSLLGSKEKLQKGKVNLEDVFIFLTQGHDL